MLICLILLTGCGTTSYNCQPWPYAGKQVADEIDRICKGKDCVHLEEWINRLNKLKRSLNACKI